MGFRPFVYRLATELGLSGWVNNSPEGVSIEAEGGRGALAQFLVRLPAERPALSSIQSLEPSWLDEVGFQGFTIRKSDASRRKSAIVLPDIATCPDCVLEILDPADRRITGRASTEREAAALIAMGQAEVGPGVRAAAAEFGLDFVPIGWEAFDLALHRGIFFRNLFQQLLDYLRGSDCRRQANMLGGYDLAELGTLVWTGAD